MGRRSAEVRRLSAGSQSLSLRGSLGWERGGPGGCLLDRVGNAILVFQNLQNKLPLNPDIYSKSNDQIRVTTFKVGSWHFQLYQVPAGMDVNENMVEGGGEMELVEGGAEK